MAIETIKNTGAYQAGSIDIQPLAASKASGVNTVESAITNDRTDSGSNDEGSKQGEASITQIRAAISEANYKATRTRCEFSVDDATNRISIKVIDKMSEEVIREIPPEESLEMLAKIWELAGLIVDEKR
ncbi:flagellar protein FlaG [Mobilisporobacter senegalensis]|uniref:Flagellar protein FlaG n=1 Tax=Mobilisporobacter senegalensis TaxID=1329262 RepID=A0A3N1XYB4_9FIRM|nr:flagellar protein FlaG [Mobilisporobacter senegalensis]ROR31549.1 flagellar protein FlaG [Mobilisporobacter senegalensis]